MARPRVGLTMWRRNFDDSFETSPYKYTLAHEYVAAVADAGALPLMLPTMADAESVGQLLDTVDGVIITGGGDVQPDTYGAEPDRSYGIDEARDGFEILLARTAHQRHLPVLGICRGIQIINVAFGGTLKQHMLGDNLENADAHPRVYKVPAAEVLARRHKVAVAPASILAKIFQTAEVYVNSLHHQAVDIVARDFAVTAVAADNTVEAIELADGSADIVAVQWHPEKMRDTGGDQLLGWFVDSLRARQTP